jgi:hypothetical protein
MGGSSEDGHWQSLYINIAQTPAPSNIYLALTESKNAELLAV